MKKMIPVLLATVLILVNTMPVGAGPNEPPPVPAKIEDEAIRITITCRYHAADGGILEKDPIVVFVNQDAAKEFYADDYCPFNLNGYWFATTGVQVAYRIDIRCNYVYAGTVVSKEVVHEYVYNERQYWGIDYTQYCPETWNGSKRVGATMQPAVPFYYPKSHQYDLHA